MPQQLQMIWPGYPARAPEPAISKEYALRPLQDGDEGGHVRVMREAGFASWTEAQLATWRQTIALPDGIFVIVHEGSGDIVATAMASHHPINLHPSGGELGWVAADPAHKGNGLGMAVCIAALRRLLDAGYSHIYLLTDDHRLPAIKTYLKMGFVPFLCATDMEPRWKAVTGKLAWPMDPDTWARAPEDLWARDQTESRPDSDRVERYPVRQAGQPFTHCRVTLADGNLAVCSPVWLAQKE